MGLHGRRLFLRPGSPKTAPPQGAESKTGAYGKCGGLKPARRGPRPSPKPRSRDPCGAAPGKESRASVLILDGNPSWMPIQGFPLPQAGGRERGSGASNGNLAGQGGKGREAWGGGEKQTERKNQNGKERRKDRRKQEIWKGGQGHGLFKG